jgi:hypothetical protein
MRVFSGVELYICCWKLEENAGKGIIYRKDEDFETFWFSTGREPAEHYG